MGLLAGDYDYAFTGIEGAMVQMRGRLQAIAVTTAKRIRSLPAVGCNLFAHDPAHEFSHDRWLGVSEVGVPWLRVTPLSIGPYGPCQTGRFGRAIRL